MKIKGFYKVLLILLATLLLLTALGVVYYHGEWWFPLLQVLRTYPAPDLHEALPMGEMQEWKLEDLIAQENVTYSETLMLVNSSHPLPDGYEAELIEYNGAKMHPLMLDGYIALRDDVQAKTGVRIYVASDYRTAQEQAEILQSSEDGIAAQIGCSEHEAGLALDVYAPHFDGKSFLRSRAGRMVNRICAEYGYIIRYPSGKEEITGIAYEPWHLRYVGEVHAGIMTESGLTMEEYIELFKPGVWYESDGTLLARMPADGLLLPCEFARCEISPDNTGYYLVTLYK